jgi:hypothetical protein
MFNVKDNEKNENNEGGGGGGDQVYFKFILF